MRALYLPSLRPFLYLPFFFFMKGARHDHC